MAGWAAAGPALSFQPSLLMHKSIGLPAAHVALSPSRLESPQPSAWWRTRPELCVFAGLILVFSGPALWGAAWRGMMFLPAAVQAGQWWRLLTHPFVHITWYHLLLDGAAFLLLYHGLLESRLSRRLLFVGASAVGSLLLAWGVDAAVFTTGLCGLSGIAHGLMAVSAVEMMLAQPRGSTEWRIGAGTFAVVIGKATWEVISGKVLFGFLYFGMVGQPVTVSHAGGIVGGLLAVVLLRMTHPVAPIAVVPTIPVCCDRATVATVSA